MTSRVRTWGWGPALLSLSLLTAGLALGLGGCPPMPSDNDNTNEPVENENSGGGNENANSAVNQNTNSAPSGNTNSNGQANANDNSGGGGGDANTNSVNANDNIAPTPPPGSFELQQLVKTGDAVPGQSGATFSELGTPVIDEKGRVAFWALYRNGAGNGGLYVWDSGTLKKIVDDNPGVTGVVPSRGASDYFGPFARTSTFEPLTQPLAWGGGDRLVFAARTAGPTASRGIYRWRATDGNMVRVVDREQIAALYPNTSAALWNGNFQSLAVSDAGIAFFAVTYNYFTNPPGSQLVSGSGVFTSNGTALTTVADSQLTPAGGVPDQGGGARFTSLAGQVTMNFAGEGLFHGAYTGGNGASGAYLRTSSNVVRIIDSRSPAAWPGLAGGTQLDPDEEGLAAVSNGPRGDIAVAGPLLIAGTKRDAVLLYRRPLESWLDIVSPSGAAASRLLSGVTDDGLALVLIGGSPYLGGGASAMRLDGQPPAGLAGATLDWAAVAAGAVNNHERAVLVYSRAPGGSANLGLAFWNGTQLLVVADGSMSRPAADLVNIAIQSGPERDRPGRSGVLNDRDELTFRAVTAGPDAIGGTGDDVQSIYRARGLP